MNTELFTAKTTTSNRTTSMAINLASIESSEQWTCINIVSFIYLDIVLTHQGTTTTLLYCSNLNAIRSEDFYLGPEWLANCNGTKLANRSLSFSPELFTSSLWDYNRSILSHKRVAAFLAKAIFFFFDASNFLPIFPYNIWIRSIQECTWRRK